ncbi:MAG: hypothetical protein LBH37_00295 [Oscillospiraceae bacterium]|jgi:hypothetical protein|nr:hypothetical protein [Oscillospiraceae bacterium]
MNFTKKDQLGGIVKLMTLIFASFLICFVSSESQDVHRAYAVKYEELRNGDDNLVVQNTWNFDPPIYEVINGSIVKSEFTMKRLLDYQVVYYQYTERRGGFYVLGAHEELPLDRQFIIPGRFASKSLDGSAVKVHLKSNAEIYQLIVPEADNFVTKYTPMKRDTDLSFSPNDVFYVKGFTGDFYVISREEKSKDCLFINVRDVTLSDDYSPRDLGGDYLPRNSMRITFSNQWSFHAPIHAINKNGDPVYAGKLLKSGEALNGIFVEDSRLGYLFKLENNLAVAGKFLAIVSEYGNLLIAVPKEGARFFKPQDAHDDFLNGRNAIEEAYRQFPFGQPLYVKGVSPDSFLVCPQDRFEEYNDLLIILKEDVINRDELEGFFSVSTPSHEGSSEEDESFFQFPDESEKLSSKYEFKIEEEDSDESENSSSAPLKYEFKTEEFENSSSASLKGELKIEEESVGKADDFYGDDSQFLGKFSERPFAPSSAVKEENMGDAGTPHKPSFQFPSIFKSSAPPLATNKSKTEGKDGEEVDIFY